MNERRAQWLRFHGFALLLFALLQGRAHIEVFLVAFLVILIGLNATALRISERFATVVFFGALGSAYAGIIHGVGTASELIEQLVPLFGILAAVLFLPTIILTLYGLRPGVQQRGA